MSVRRRELKYSIDLLEYHVLRKKVLSVLRPDQHMITGGGYHVRNLYFDDYNDSAYWEKEAGTYQRKKYRLRIYNNDASIIKFERKSKIGYYVIKETVCLTRQQAEQMVAGNFDFLAETPNKLLHDFYLSSRCTFMKPVVIVDYDREAYVQPIGNVRVTFDNNLRTGLGVSEFFSKNAAVISALERPEMVLEVKYTDVLPSYVKGLFPTTIKPQEAIGKFSICRSQQMLQTGTL